MSFSVNTGAVTGDKFLDELGKLSGKLPESQHARDECVVLVEQAAKVAARMFEEDVLGPKDIGGWSLGVSGHSIPRHEAGENESSDEFVGISLNHHSPASMDYYESQKRSS